MKKSIVFSLFIMLLIPLVESLCASFYTPYDVLGRGYFGIVLFILSTFLILFLILCPYSLIQTKLSLQNFIKTITVLIIINALCIVLNIVRYGKRYVRSFIFNFFVSKETVLQVPSEYGPIQVPSGYDPRWSILFSFLVTSLFLVSFYLFCRARYTFKRQSLVS